MILKKLEPHVWVFDAVNFDAIESLEEVLNDLFANSVLKAESKLKQILSEYPDFIDCWVLHLAILYERTGRDIESYLANREAYRIGLSALPKEFDWTKDCLDWGFHENRPFLRACFNLVLQIIDTSMRDEAWHILNNLIHVSPNDNLGARYLLLKMCLLDKNIEAAEQLFKQYPDDYSTEFYYGKVLLALMQNDPVSAQSALEQAKLEFPFVLKELKKKRHIQPKGFDGQYILRGGKEEAYIYWREFGALWQQDSENYRFLIGNS